MADGIDTLTPNQDGPPSSSTLYPVQTNPWRSEPSKSQFLDVVQSFLSNIDLDGILPGGAEEGSVAVRVTSTGASGPTTQWHPPMATTGILRSGGTDTATAFSQIITGKVTGSSGAIAFGTGFTVSHPSTGRWVITFTTSFVGTPLAVASVTGTTNARTCTLNSFAANTFAVNIKDNTNAATDEDFQFIAIEFA